LPLGPPFHNCKFSPLYQNSIPESQTSKEASKSKVFYVLNEHIMKMYGGVKIQLHAFLNSVLDGGD
jgi:hypothetical protein